MAYISRSNCVADKSFMGVDVCGSRGWMDAAGLKEKNGMIVKTAGVPQMLCSGLCKRVAPGTVSISLR